MKKIAWFTGALVVAFLVLLGFSTPEFGQKYRALGSVGHTLLSSSRHQAPILKCGSFLISARYNVDVVTRCAEYISTVGSNKRVFLEIAEVAAEADRDYPRLDDVLDLAVMRSSESMTVIALARSVCRLETAEQEEQWQAVYDAMREGAEYPSLEAALAARAGS
jgi:hypothetical protein